MTKSTFIHIETLFLTLCAIWFSPAAFSQDGLFDGASEAGILFSDEMTFGGDVCTFGIGGHFRKNTSVDYYKTRFYEIGFTTYRPAKQEWVYPYIRGYKRYVFGKINTVAMLRGSYGMTRKIADKPYWGGVTLDYVLAGGITIAFAKPIYLYVMNIQRYEDGILSYTESIERYDPEKHNDINILGSAPFATGITETKIYPGVNVKTGLNFEYGEYSNVVKSLEVGLTADYLPKGIKVLAYNKDVNFCFSLYLSFIIGKRYN